MGNTGLDSNKRNLKLKVHWKMTNPPIEARSWHRWEPDRLGAMSKIDRNAVLEIAFNLGLARDQGWDFRNLKPQAQKALVEAARIYKRGVTTLGGKTLSQSGAYEILCQDAAPELPLNGSFVVADKEFAAHWPQLAKNFDYIWKSSELAKNLEAVDELLSAWRKAGSLQHWCVFGGGVLSDVAAFAAALSGSLFTLYPTTLLSMLDACVGGKTGVNVEGHGKNQVGLFAFPQAVVVCTEFLATLSERHYLAGVAEALKHSFLAGNRDFTRDLATKAKNRISKELITKAIKVKAEIVSIDPSEIGIRKTLNLGHTLAHAFESISHEHSKSDYLIHGEAVALGLLFALQASRDHADLSSGDFNFCCQALRESSVLLTRARLESLLDMELGCPKAWDKIWAYLKKDKKVSSKSQNSSEWVLLAAFGQVAIGTTGEYTISLSEVEVKRSFKSFCGLLDD